MSSIMRPFLFGPTSSVMNLPEFQRLRAQSAQRLKQPVSLERFKAHKPASKGASKPRISAAEAERRLNRLISKCATNRQPAKRQMSVADAEARLYRRTSAARAQTVAVALGLRAGILRRPLAWD